MINRVQSVSHNSNYKQNFGLLRVERKKGLNLFAESMKLLHASGTDLDDKLIELGSTALRLAQEMGTEIVVSSERTGRGQYRLFLDATREGKPLKLVNLGTISKHADDETKVSQTRIFLDTFTRSVDDMYADEFGIK